MAKNKDKEIDEKYNYKTGDESKDYVAEAQADILLSEHEEREQLKEEEND